MKKEENSFVKLVFLFLSLIFDFFRSIWLLFWIKNEKLKNNLFFDFLHFIFVLWPKYFWEKPSFYKLFSFFWDLFEYLILQNEKK